MSVDIIDFNRHGAAIHVHQPLSSEQVVYLMIQGYVGPQPVVLAPYQGRTVPGAPVLPATYTESLLTWFRRQIETIPQLTLEVGP